MTSAEAGWIPALPTPNHPEYPAAHSCVAGALAAVLRAFYGSDALQFELDSSVTGNSRRYRSVGALVDEIARAHITGGMHFRHATEAGTRLGEQVGHWVATQAFVPRQP